MVYTPYMDTKNYRFGYGFNCGDLPFKGLDITDNKLFLDTAKSKRQARTDMLNVLRSGGVVVLFNYGHLGYGRELPAIKQIIADAGCTIEGPKERGEAVSAPVGRKPYAKWTQEQIDAIKPLWQDMRYSAEYVINEAAKLTGQPVKRHNVKDNCGNRNVRGG